MYIYDDHDDDLVAKLIPTLATCQAPIYIYIYKLSKLSIKGKKTPIFTKQAKDFNRFFTKEDTYMCVYI